MELEIRAGRASGTVKAPPAKSAAHRLLLCAGLCHGTSVVRNVAFSEDILATIDVLRAIGAKVYVDEDYVFIRGTDVLRAECGDVISCRESGSTLRFCIPLLLLSGSTFTLTGQGRLMQRPQSVYEKLCRDQGLRFEMTGDTISLAGPLKAGRFEIPGDISSQFISGLLFALPLLDADSTIRLIPPVESRSYIDITISALRAFGVRAEWTDETTLRVPGGQSYTPWDIAVEGDWSNAAFFGALKALGDDVTVTGLNPNSLQGDRVYEAYFDALKAGCAELDISDCPDLGPILMATAAGLHGCVLRGTKRLAIKESDRGAAMAEELEKLGVACDIGENTILVSVGLRTPTEPLSAHNDHRIAMACAVLLTRVGGTITGAEAVKKSFPDFFDRLRGLGIEVNEHASGNEL